MHFMTRDSVPALSASLRRLGAWGFVFFLAKGLLWLTLPYLAAVLLD